MQPTIAKELYVLALDKIILACIVAATGLYVDHLLDRYHRREDLEQEVIKATTVDLPTNIVTDLREPVNAAATVLSAHEVSGFIPTDNKAVKQLQQYKQTVHDLSADLLAICHERAPRTAIEHLQEEVDSVAFQAALEPGKLTQQSCIGHEQAMRAAYREVQVATDRELRNDVRQAINTLPESPLLNKTKLGWFIAIALLLGVAVIARLSKICI